MEQSTAVTSVLTCEPEKEAVKRESRERTSFQATSCLERKKRKIIIIQYPLDAHGHTYLLPHRKASISNPSMSRGGLAQLRSM